MIQIRINFKMIVITKVTNQTKFHARRWKNIWRDQKHIRVTSTMKTHDGTWWKDHMLVHQRKWPWQKNILQFTIHTNANKIIYFLHYAQDVTTVPNLGRGSWNIKKDHCELTTFQYSNHYMMISSITWSSLQLVQAIYGVILHTNLMYPLWF